MENSPSRSRDSDGPEARHVESVEGFEELVDNEERVLVDFYADWCGPCQVMAPTVDELAGESDATVAKVDVDDVSAVAATYDVRSIPAFIVFEEGEPVERLVGVQEKADLGRALE